MHKKLSGEDLQNAMPRQASSDSSRDEAVMNAIMHRANEFERAKALRQQRERNQQK